MAKQEGGADADVDELFSVRPEEFVAARNALVKSLKAAGERERAVDVAAWRRPTPIDWALNQVARDDADAIDRFTGAAAAAQKAQASALSGRREDLRAAVAGVRESSATVAALAAAALAGQSRATASARAAVSTRLAEIAAEPSLAAQLAEGRLGAGVVEAEGAFGFGAVEEGPARASARAPAPRAGSRRTRAQPDDGKDAAQAHKQAAAEAKHAREQARAVEKAERANDAAQGALAAATEALEQAEAECATARAQLDRAERARAKASTEHGRRRDAADVAAAALDQARQL